MRTSQYSLFTMKSKPSDAEIISHKLMICSGMIRKMSSGLYIWLPLGLRVLKKVESIIRKSMNNIGAIEISMPIIQSADLWKKSGRWKQYGSELLRFIDRNNRQFIFSPTHEETITDLIHNELNSYKQLPLIFFQIQTKFRDEVRPRFGVIRSREFLMKDAYSFHTSQESLQNTYSIMCETYSKIFTYIGLNFRIVQASTGSIGGNVSHEFQVLSQSGENCIVFSNISDYAANIEFAEAIAPNELYPEKKRKMKLVNTPEIKTTNELIKYFNLSIERVVKTILVKAANGSKQPFIALLVRGDHQLNIVKAERLPQVACPLIFASEAEVKTIMNASSSSIGPVNMPIPMVIDRTVAAMSNFIAGANIDGKYYFDINWNRDVMMPEIADIRNAVTGDFSPDGNGTLIAKRSIEVGHVFQLGTKYSQIMNTTVQDRNGYNKLLVMGCYGIGITRVVAAIIEQNHDEHGIIWPDSVAPFQVAILPVNKYKSYQVSNFSENLYRELCANSIEVLIDDRKEYFGIMFNDIELIGIPHIIVISDRNLRNSKIEYQCRRSNMKILVKTDDIVSFLIKIIQK